MNDRILDALVAAGMDTSPLSLLDHASAQTSTFFALYDQELVYLEGVKSSRVALRDVTRIHSDREGMLRVETSAHTAVTASLLGYDPGRVQTFFQQVRDVTARAKELPVLPLSSKPAESAPGAALPESSVPGFSTPDLGKSAPSLSSASLSSTSLSSASLSSASMPGVSAYTPAAHPVTVPPAAPVVIAPVAQPVSDQANSGQPATAQVTPVQATPVQAVPAQPAATSQMPTPAQDGASENAPGATLTAPSAAAVLPAPGPPAPSPVAAPGAAFMPAGAIRAAVPRPEPVIISSMPPVSALPAFQERAGERNRQAIRAAPVAEVSPSTPPAGVQTKGTQVSDVRTAEFPAAAHTQGPLVSVPAASAGQDADLRSELLRRADSVGALARTVGLLAVVLGLAALGLAFFQWNAGTSLSAIWTLLTGGVGTVALLAFAEALRLLSALARSQQA